MSNVSDIIKHDLNIFKEHYETLRCKQPSDKFIKKKQEISANKCFYMSYEEYHEVKNTKSYKPTWTHTNDTPKTQNRLYIITSDFTEDTQSKKKFIGHMNKLTDQNKDTIFPKLKELLNDSTYHIIWDFIKKSPKQIYIDLLMIHNFEMTLNYFDDFVNKKEWYPPEFVFDKSILSGKDESYDLFCDYVKWKKRVVNIMIAFSIIFTDAKQQFDKIVDDLYDLFYVSEYRQITDFCLEQILLLKAHISKDHAVITKLKNIDREMDSSTKFLILDIIE